MNFEHLYLLDQCSNAKFKWCITHYVYYFLLWNTETKYIWCWFCAPNKAAIVEITEKECFDVHSKKNISPRASCIQLWKVLLHESLMVTPQQRTYKHVFFVISWTRACLTLGQSGMTKQIAQVYNCMKILYPYLNRAINVTLDSRNLLRVLGLYG